jgi:hypothetical protein
MTVLRKASGLKRSKVGTLVRLLMRRTEPAMEGGIGGEWLVVSLRFRSISVEEVRHGSSL